jgi:hypothetical protein
MKVTDRLGSTLDQEVERLDGLGAFIWQERERIRAAVGRQNTPGGENSTVECRIRGASMEAAIPRGSRIRITFSRQQHRVGDVVAFMIGERIVVHRIVHRARRYLLTRGDAMLLPDPPIESAAVLGAVDTIDSGSGWRQPAAQSLPPRRDRLLAFVVLMSGSLLLKLDADLARRFIEWLDACDQRHAWTRKLLYR